LSALLFKQIRELTEAVAELKERVAVLERRPSTPLIAEKRPVGRPPKVSQ
jgi:hypothetical protein